MRRLRVARSLVAGLLALAMVISITGLFGASGVAVKITTPKAGAKVSGVLHITAALKGAPKAAYVILGVDDDRPFSSNAAPYTFEVDTTALSDGAHRIFVEAYDNYGLLASSKAMTVFVRNGAAPLVQAKKAAPARIASKSKQAASVAKATPSAPAARTPGKQGGAAVTMDSLATEPAPSNTAPTMTARGPLPEPSHSIAATRVAPATMAAAEAGSRTSFAAAAATDLPPAAGSTGGVRGHTLLVNGQMVRFSVHPYIESGRMHAGFRGLFQQAGAKVTWHKQERLARSVKGAETVEVVVGERMASVNGQKIDMGSTASIRDSRMMIPLRFFARMAGAALHWNHETKTADLQVGDRAMAERPLSK